MVFLAASITMQTNVGAFAALAAVIVAIAPFAQADQCYSQSGCPNCESRDSMFEARSTFCGSDAWATGGDLNWGFAGVRLDGRFAVQQECYDGFDSIIDQCYGNADGGIYTYDFNGDSARLDVDFCNCE